MSVLPTSLLPAVRIREAQFDTLAHTTPDPRAKIKVIQVMHGHG